MTTRSPIIRVPTSIPRAVSQVPSAYPPGANLNAPAPRLPSLNGAQPYVPPAVSAPPPQQAPVLGVAETYEAYSVELPWPGIQFQSVYTTKRRWRAIDVYVENTDPNAGTRTGLLTVYIYAVSQFGSRTLVASGRYDVASFDATGETQVAMVRPEWVAAGRAVAERYEVAIQVRKPTIGQVLPGKVKVTIACADEMVEPPPFLGAVPFTSTAIQWFAAGLPAPAPLELCGIWGVVGPGVAAERYITVVDSNGNGATTLAPLMIFPLGSAPGQGFSNFDLRWRAKLNPRVLVSSTPNPITIVNDCSVGVLVR